MRAAIYARFSSELQDERSITDQVSLARAYAASRGFKVMAVYEDAAISGASVINRPGLQRLLSDAAASTFDAVITESLDRLSRSQADIAALYERLSFLGVSIETLADGRVSEIHVGLKGTMSALFLKDLAQKTRRGQIGRVKAGRIPGGRSYGYDVVEAVDDRGRRIINEQEAGIVRRIFAEYAAARGSLAIVRGLNGEGVPGPSGGVWNVSALIGSPKRRNGILNNELYRGVVVYNRQRFVKDPATGKRVSRANPESEWLRQDVPELRIVEEKVWLAVQRIREARGGPQIHTKRGPRRLLSGLVFCGCCGAKYNIATKDHMRCSAQVNSGSCKDSRVIRMTEIESRVCSAVAEHVLTDELFAIATSNYQDEFNRAQGDRGAMRTRLETELADIEKKSARLLRMVEDGHSDPAVAGPRLNELASRKRELQAELQARPDDAPGSPPGDAAASYRRLVNDLRDGSLSDTPEEPEAFQLIRGLVRRVVVKPTNGQKRQALEVEAGSAPVRHPADLDCNFGCGGWI